MASLKELWQVLRDTSLEPLAPTLLQHGVRCLNDVSLKTSDLLDSGIKQWQIEQLLAGPKQVELVPPPRRADLPQPFSGRKASLAAALAAAHPNERQRSLELLDSDVLAKSTNPTQEARVKTYLAICRAWEVDPWPLTLMSVRCFGASLKLGGYRSAPVYFQAVCSHQQRCLSTAVPSIVRCCIRDCIRSILRGLGATRLKDSFNALCLGDVQVTPDDGPFSFDEDAHIKDMAIICTWYMLRESEMANACLSHLSLQGNEAQLLIPIHKTDGYGKLTARSLRCSCTASQHRMCVWHACERHLIRLHQRPELPQRNNFPLFPTSSGRAASKTQFIGAIRRVLQLAGVQLTRNDPHGRPMDRFSGHTLRVAGAQMLARAGVPLDHIQLLGRWSSQAVQRYTQDSALAVVPGVTQVVADTASASHRLETHVGVTSSTTAGSEAASSQGAPKKRLKTSTSSSPTGGLDEAAWKQLADLQQEMSALKGSLDSPPEVFIFRPRAKVLHRPFAHEADNQPHVWRAKCGWAYGSSNFWRTSECLSHHRRCKKCFDLGDNSDSDESSSSGASGVITTDGDSSSSDT